MLWCNFFHSYALDVRGCWLGQNPAWKRLSFLVAQQAFLRVCLIGVVATIVVTALNAIAHTKLTGFRRQANFQLAFVSRNNTLHVTQLVLLFMK